MNIFGGYSGYASQIQFDGGSKIHSSKRKGKGSRSSQASHSGETKTGEKVAVRAFDPVYKHYNKETLDTYEGNNQAWHGHPVVSRDGWQFPAYVEEKKIN